MRLHAMAAASAGCMALASCGETLTFHPVDAGGDLAIAPVLDAAPEGESDAPLECAEVPCNATIVADEEPRAIAATDDVVAWTIGDDLRVMDVEAGTPTTVYSWSAGDLNGDVFVADTAVYFTEGGGLRRCGKTVCSNPAAPIYGLATLGPIAVDSEDKFVAEVAAPRRIARCRGAASCGPSPEYVVRLPSAPRHLHATSAHLVVGLSNGAIYTLLRSSEIDAGEADAADGVDAASPSLVLVAAAGVLGGVAANNTFVYWIDRADATLRRCSLGGCTMPDVVAQGLASPQRLVLDRGYLYWTEKDANAVRACPADACSAPRTIARVAQPTLLAVGDRVYVVSEGEKKVYATRRQP